ncbi:MAG: hypothetical protein V1932_04825 [Chloroflexota bacterium]
MESARLQQCQDELPVALNYTRAPVMTVGLTNHLWAIEEIVKLVK